MTRDPPSIFSPEDPRDTMAELERLMRGYQLECDECEQIAGKALGYPWYKDDQKNCPGATEADGVCVGEHVPSSVVAELARRYTEANSVSPDAKATALEMAREICINILGAGDPSQTLVVNGDIHITDEGIFAVAAYLESASPPDPDALAVIEAARRYIEWEWAHMTLDDVRQQRPDCPQDIALWEALAAYDKAKRPTPAVAADTEALAVVRFYAKSSKDAYEADQGLLARRLIASLRKGAGT